MKVWATGTAAATIAAAIVVASWPAASPAAAEVEGGGVFRDCEACPEMVVVPAGSAMAAATDEELGTSGRGTTIDQPFALGRYEITFDEWQACADAGGCAKMPDDHGWGRGRRPVINVNLAQVRGYIRWLAERTGQPYRLPTDAEWEYAHRAGTRTPFWWGDEVGRGHANCRDCGSTWSGRSTAPVGSFSPNPLGLHDTTGNVWEWVSDCWESASPISSPDTTEVCRSGIIRGGAWYYLSKTARADWRSGNDRRLGSYTIGFRVARDLP